ncbi:hypothetical protein [uncultured Amnibacterium sp.]|uniref:hypothetical protein n=1 Tax=uncultured Amnibacterium sp. TaxID=1631851 RepID=UPI0035CA7CB6
MDERVRNVAQRDPEAALDEFDLTATERTLLLAGEVGKLSLAGSNAFLLSYLPRWNLFGLDVDLYSERMRAVAGSVVPLNHETDELGLLPD